jgi:NAD(P)-dependent dehydrogenase (short-subunit alcohol dehydrogenase family)
VDGNKPLSGKIALVTGAGRGIGREIALPLARDGANLFVHYSGSDAGAKERLRRSPGMMDTAPEGARKFFENASPFGRIGQASEIAAVVAFLASSEASRVSGDHILANGANS